MSSIFPRSVLSALLFFAVSGCGGSGGSSASSEAPSGAEPAQQVRTVSLDKTYVQADEVDVLPLSGQFTRPDSLLLSQSPDIGLEVLSFRDNQVSLRIPGVDRPSLSDLELTFVYGDQSIVKSVSFLAQNVSASSLEQQVQDTLEEKESIVELTQDFSLYRFFIDYAYLYDLLIYLEKEQRLAEFSPLESASTSSTGSAIESLAAEFDAYRQGQLSDQALEQALSLAEAAILEHGRYGSQMLQTIQPLVEVLVPGLSRGDLVYVPEVGIYSRFLSTPIYGQIRDGQMREAVFEVAEPYMPIESLIRARKTQSLTCENL